MRAGRPRSQGSDITEPIADRQMILRRFVEDFTDKRLLAPGSSSLLKSASVGVRSRAGIAGALSHPSTMHDDLVPPRAGDPPVASDYIAPVRMDRKPGHSRGSGDPEAFIILRPAGEGVREPAQPAEFAHDGSAGSRRAMTPYDSSFRR